jgi:hypothetical protein
MLADVDVAHDLLELLDVYHRTHLRSTVGKTIPKLQDGGRLDKSGNKRIVDVAVQDKT